MAVSGSGADRGPEVFPVAEAGRNDPIICQRPRGNILIFRSSPKDGSDLNISQKVREGVVVACSPCHQERTISSFVQVQTECFGDLSTLQELG